MPRPEYMNPYGQNRNPAYSQNAGPNMGALGRTPLLQDPIANADPEMLAMLEAIMNATMGANGGRGGNPYSQPGFSQGRPRDFSPPRPAGKAAGNTFDTPMGYGAGAPYGNVQSGPSASELAKRRRLFGTGGSGGVGGMQRTQGGMFPVGANMKIQGESDYAVQNVRDRVWSFEDLRMAAESPIFASQNLGISQQAAQAALSRLMAQQGRGMGTGVTGGLDIPGGGFR